MNIVKPDELEDKLRHIRIPQADITDVITADAPFIAFTKGHSNTLTRWLGRAAATTLGYLAYEFFVPQYLKYGESLIQQQSVSFVSVTTDIINSVAYNVVAALSMYAASWLSSDSVRMQSTNERTIARRYAPLVMGGGVMAFGLMVGLFDFLVQTQTDDLLMVPTIMLLESTVMYYQSWSDYHTKVRRNRMEHKVVLQKHTA